MRLVPLLLVVALLPGCGGGSSDGAAPAGTPASETPTPEEQESEGGYAFADYDFTEFDRNTCYKTEKLGSRTSVTLSVKNLTGAYPFIPNCLTDVKADHVKVTVIGDVAPHDLIMQGNDIELTIDPGKRGTATFDLPDGKAIYFACTFHPSMVGAFFR